jgi:hypothetical protein
MNGNTVPLATRGAARVFSSGAEITLPSRRCFATLLRLKG